MSTPRIQIAKTKSGPALLLLLLLSAAPLLFTPSAQAGCGCDHPPPEWSPVMPIFAPAGATIRIHEDGKAFTVGKTYRVEFDHRRSASVVAEHAGFVEVEVPHGVDVGPAHIEVSEWKRGWFGWYTREIADYDSEHFTVLPPFVPLPSREGVFLTRSFKLAIDTEGTVLIPVDLTQIVDPYQFAFQFTNLALSFGPDDVVIYNKDGVDLTLFTLAVDDSPKRTFGSYYGWEVEEDRDLRGYRYQNRTGRAWNLSRESDILTYWRHEFLTYAFAHMDGMTHEVDEDGYHPDASLHIDHSYIVLAIRGTERNRYFPNSQYLESDLRPGSRRVQMRVALTMSEEPVEPEEMISLIEGGRPDLLDEMMGRFVPAELALQDLYAWLMSLDAPKLNAALRKLEITLREAAAISERAAERRDD
jgi:hypothetical protein